MRPIAYLYPYKRNFLMLDGDDFQIRIDPNKIGAKRKWFQPKRWNDRNPIFKSVPSCWQTWGKQIFEKYAGTIWYLKKFNISPNDIGLNSEDKLKFLSELFSLIKIDFTASEFETEVWINGFRVGLNRGGYSRFSFDVTNFLHWGENTIIIRLLDDSRNRTVPYGKQGGSWFSQVSGIWGSMYLEFIKGPLIFEDIFVKTIPLKEENGSWVCEIIPTFKNYRNSNNKNNNTSPVFQIELVDLPIETSQIDHPTDTNSFFESNNDNKILSDELTINYFNNKKKIRIKYNIENPKVWHPDEPNLYGLKLKILNSERELLDSITLEFGFRYIETKNSLIYLNGNPIMMRGVIDQGFHPDTIYNYPLDEGSPDAFIKKEIYLLKDMGINLNRKHLKVEDPRYIYWCDHLGMLYWASMANFMLPNLPGIKIFRNEILRMILRDRNHPSLIIYSLFNEESGIWGIWTTFWNRFIGKTVRSIRSYDNTRLIIDNSGWAHAK
ncbi:MAG: hypothetical protein GY870_00055, partial [archaeon]|nr:hypothetical protein [archaeon]